MGTHPANLIPPPAATKHASALSVDGTPSLARCRDSAYAYPKNPPQINVAWIPAAEAAAI